MQVKSLLYVYLILFLIMICNNSHVNSEKSYLRFRNSILRIYIATDKRRPQIFNEYSHKIIEKIQKIKLKIMNKYYDFNLFYNKLSEEEKEMVNFIISLCY